MFSFPCYCKVKSGLKIVYLTGTTLSWKEIRCIPLKTPANSRIQIHKNKSECQPQLTASGLLIDYRFKGRGLVFVQV